MKEKTQYEALMEELQKMAENFRARVVEIGETLAQILPDVEIPEEEEEEEPWEMKCPYNYNDSYYYISVSGNVSHDCWCGFEGEKESFEAGNIFKTKEAAELESKRRKLLAKFRAFRDECNGDWKADWKKQDKKYFLYYSQKFDIISIDYINICEKFNLFGYFKNEKDAERAIKLFGDEIKKLFIDCECD